MKESQKKAFITFFFKNTEFLSKPKRWRTQEWIDLCTNLNLIKDDPKDKYELPHTKSPYEWHKVIKLIYKKFCI